MLNMFKNIFIALLVLLTWLSSHVFFVKTYNKADEAYLPPPIVIQYLTAGFKVQVADAFWLRAVQDFDHCSKVIAKQVCEGKSWLYSVLNLASTLDSRLEPVMYQTGGLALSILVGDIEGAKNYFDRGVRVYPEVWQISYAAAYHAMYEEKNKAKAARLYLLAFEKGAPYWTQSLAGRLAADGGDVEYAEKILEDMIAQNKDEKLIIRLKNKLQAVRSEKK